MKVYIDEVENWPAYEITAAKEPSFSFAREIPDELWHRYCEAGRAYWAAQQEILDHVGIKKEQA